MKPLYKFKKKEKRKPTQKYQYPHSHLASKTRTLPPAKLEIRAVYPQLRVPVAVHH